MRWGTPGDMFASKQICSSSNDCDAVGTARKWQLAALLELLPAHAVDSENR